MDQIISEITKHNNTNLFTSPPPPLPLPIPPPPPPPLSLATSIENRISPTIFLIIVILAVIFFISGLLHLLVRYLLRPSNREPDDSENLTALQGQLQQLFHLHDAGVDQSFIDTLPIFLYKAIIGLKDPFDCAVCLCEFEPDDKLRLLPKCSHAFHLECIDTWLLSHSTCPLCRSSLLPEFSPTNSPLVFVLESGSESSREIAADRSDHQVMHSADEDFVPQINFAAAAADAQQKIAEGNNTTPKTVDEDVSKVVQVKLGKFKSAEVVDSYNNNNNGENVRGEGSSSGNVNVDERRCFSMGAYEYVMDESSLLHVAIKPQKKKPSNIKKPGHRSAMSECDCHSKREGFKGFNPTRNSLSGNACSGSSSSKLQKSSKDSYSISKIWLRQKKESSVDENYSRRAFSFRLPVIRSPATDEGKMNSTLSEFEGSECGGIDLENQSVASSSARIGSTPSFSRRTLLWIIGNGRQNNRVGNHLV